MNKKSILQIVELCVIALLWFIADHAAKAYVMQYGAGEQITPSILGIFHITYVKNTGAAFGLFVNNPVPLAIFSIAIFSVLIAIYLAHLRRLKAGTTKFKITHLHTFSLAIVCAGGISNVVDRLTLGYVVDYIDLDFMKWPVFNIADIGVTCGIVLLIIAMIANFMKVSKAQNEAQNEVQNKVQNKAQNAQQSASQQVERSCNASAEETDKKA